MPIIAWIINVTGIGKAWAYAGSALAVVTAVGLLLLRVRAGGRAAERAARSMEVGKIKHEQLKSAISSPRGPRALADSLRDGSF